MTIASDLFRTITVKINDISQQLPYIVVNQADDNGKIIRFVPLDHGQKVTGFTGARLYYPPRSDNEYGDYVTGVESDGAWDFTIPVGVLSAGRVGCNLAFIDGDGETYSRNVVFLVEPAVSGVFDPGDGQQTRLDKVIGTVQTAADTAIGNINQTVDDAMESIGKAEQSINESVTAARGSANAAANSEQQASASAGAAQTSERNAANSATQASQSATAAKQSETNAASSASAAKASETNAADSATAAQQAVDGFGLEVGTTTTGEPGTDAAVEIEKTGTKYTANFTIPRGDKGEQGPTKHDATLTGDGTVGTPLKLAPGTLLTQTQETSNDLNKNTEAGLYVITAFPSPNNMPDGIDNIRGTLIVFTRPRSAYTGQMLLANLDNGRTINWLYLRASRDNGESWGKWQRVALVDDLYDVSALSSRIAALESKSNELAAMQTRVQALDVRIKSLETNQ